MTIDKTLKDFFTNIFCIEKPLLLGFSGGEDSLALAHCLKTLSIPCTLAHYDHAWREESAKEAEDLARWAQSMGIAFLSKRSPLATPNENQAREERFAFFEQVFAEGSYHALVLGHHQKDQAETVLKRIFEGAHLVNLRGMDHVTYRGKMPVLRPLLQVPKGEITQYIHSHHLSPIDDKTNRDPKYLRARMRSALMPTLSKQFGKEIEGPLSQVGTYASRLKEYLDFKVQGIRPLNGPFGLMWDFSKAHPVEIEHVLCTHFHGKLTCSIMERILKGVEVGCTNQRVECGDLTLYVDRGHLFWIKQPLPQFSTSVPLKEGRVESGSWAWNIRFVEGEGSGSWKEWWQGKISLTLPPGKYELVPPCSTFRKKWNNHKVPAFLRETLPLVAEEGNVVGEFLIGKSPLQRPVSGQTNIQVEVNELV